MIIPHIIRGLLANNTVTISGLGTFSLECSPSYILNDKVYPPQKIVLFDFDKDADGFDFVSKLSQWHQIRIDEAADLIGKWVQTLEKSVANNKSVAFEQFGTFTFSKQKIFFEYTFNQELGLETEGFDPVELPPVKNKKTEKIKKRKTINKEKKRKNKDKLWFVLTIAVALIVLITLLLKETWIEIRQKYVVLGDETMIEDTLEIEDTAFISRQGEDTSEVKKEEIETVFAPKLTTISEALEFESGKYYVIAGSFNNKDDAKRHIKQKKLEKYNAKLLTQKTGSRVRVCIGVFENEHDANRFAANIDKDYWVLK